MLRLAGAAGLIVLSVSAVQAQDRPSITFGNDVKIGFTGRVETDSRIGASGIGVTDEEFVLNTPRAGIDGSLFKKVDFEIERDLSSAPNGWRDVYANLRLSRGLQLRAGQFKLPFGEEALTSGLEIDFVHRALISTQIAPGRDIGAMLHGSVYRRHVKYATGYFVGDGRNARSTTTLGGGAAIGGHVVVLPLSEKKGGADPSLQFSAMILRSKADDVLGLRGRTLFHDGVFYDRSYVNGTRLRTGVAASWTRGALKLSGEYMTSSDERRGMGFDEEDLAPVRADGWYTAAVWTYHPLEFVARIERQAFDASGALPGNADRVLTFGSNWNIRKYLRLQANMILEAVTDPERSPAPDAGGRFVGGVVRLQFGI